MTRPERTGIMLAHPATEKKVALMPEIILIQPKLRGERCVAEYHNGKYYLVSSYGNPFYFLEHIEKELNYLASIGITNTFDGEIYKHGWSQEEVNSAANRTKNRSPRAYQLEYHIFDLKEAWSQLHRSSVLTFNLPEFIRSAKYLKIVETSKVRKDDWMQFVNQYTWEGYEGIILRNPDSLKYYQKRTNDLLKFKPTEVDHYRIEKVNEAISEDHIPKGMVGSFTVSSSKSDMFKVGAGKMDHSLREYYWKHRSEILGLMLEVKHEKIRTDKGIPLCAVAINVVK